MPARRDRAPNATESTKARICFLCLFVAILTIILDSIFNLAFRWIYPMETIAHKRLQKLSIVIIVTLCCASAVKAQESGPSEESPPPQSASAPGGWEFSVTPYIFLARLNGTVGVVGQSADVNASFRDIFRNLEFAAMGTLEARKGNWSVLVDGMYISLEGQRVTPSPLFSDMNVEVKETIITPQVGYRVL